MDTSLLASLRSRSTPRMSCGKFSKFHSTLLGERDEDPPVIVLNLG